MDKIFRFLNHEYLAILGCLLVLFGMVFGKFILSVGSLILIGRAIVNPNIKSHFQLLWKHKDFLAIASIYLLFAVSFFWSDNVDFWAGKMRMKLPFIGMPVAFLAIRQFDRKLFWQLMYFFFWLVSFTALRSIVITLFDFENIVSNYSKGQVIPLPVHHIRFSLMVVFSICLGTELVRRKNLHGLFDNSFFDKFSRFGAWVSGSSKLVLGATIFLILYLHFIAVRSGLLAFYGVAFFYFARFLFMEKKKILGLGLAVFFIAGSFFAYKYVPTLKNKIDYTFYSINLFNEKKNLRDLSDSRRLASILAGVEIVKKHPVTGVGMGDIQDKTEEWLIQNYPDLKGLGLMPHNEFLWVVASVGLLGLLWFLAAILFPLFYRKGWKDPLLVSFYTIIFSSFLVEHTLETQVGTAVFIFPLMMIMRARLGQIEL